MNDAKEKKSNVLLIAAAWLLVAVPAGWGLSYTIQSAMKLFLKQSPVAMVPAAK